MSFQSGFRKRAAPPVRVTFLQIIRSVVFWAPLSGILGATLLLAGVFRQAPSQLLAAGSPIVVMVRILALGVLLHSAVLVLVGLLCLGAVMAGAVTTGRAQAAIRATAVFFIFAPMLFCAVAFGYWNGVFNSIVAAGTGLALVGLAAVSVVAANRIARWQHKLERWPGLWFGVTLAAALTHLIPIDSAPPAGLHPPVVDAAPQPVPAMESRPQQPSASQDGPQVVVLVTIDTLRADHLGCYGYPRETSPTIDRLAREGVLFQSMVAAASGTKPSMATLVTGMPPSVHGVTSQRGFVPSSITTMAEYFKAAGFFTAAVTTNRLLSKEGGFSQGFDQFSYLGDVSSVEVVAEARSLLPVGEESRWFLWVHFMDPHDPYVPPARSFEPFLSDDIYSSRSLPIVDYGQVFGVKIDRILGEQGRDRFSGRAVEQGAVEAWYDGDILQADQGVAALLEMLEETGTRDDATIVLTADHGETTYRKKIDVHFGHANDVYDSTVHVPALIWQPDWARAGERIDGIVRHVDLFDTTLQVAGIQADNGAWGQDLLDAHPESDFAVTQTAYWDGMSLALFDKQQPTYALVNESWKYIMYPHTDLGQIRTPYGWLHAWRSLLTRYWREDELYDRRTDPHEEINVIHRNRAQAALMRQALLGRLDHQRSSRIVAGESAPAGFEEDLLEQLKALGYID